MPNLIEFRPVLSWMKQTDRQTDTAFSLSFFYTIRAKNTPINCIYLIYKYFLCEFARLIGLDVCLLHISNDVKLITV